MQDKKTQTEIEEEEYENLLSNGERPSKIKTDDDIDPTPF